MSARAGKKLIEAAVLIRRIKIENFKSVESVVFDVEPGVNLLVGPNASGKTNILEAVAFLKRAHPSSGLS